MQKLNKNSQRSGSIVSNEKIASFHSTRLQDLVEIYDESINLCVIERQLDSGTENFVRQLLAQPYPLEWQKSVSTADCQPDSLLPPQLRKIEGYADWVADIRRLVEVFSDLLGAQQVGLRINALSKRMCPRFHVDRVPARLVCTYSGPGTEWLPESLVDRSLLAKQDIPVAGPINGKAIQTIPTAAIGLMKGEAWNQSYPHALIHRSPQLTAQYPKRLLITFDIL